MSPEPRRNLVPPLGLTLSLIGIVAIGWLAATGRLGLYIHPRYFVFTTVVVGLALVATIATWAVLGRAPGDDHDEHEHESTGPLGGRLRGAGGALAALALVVGLLVLPPSTLTSATVQQRDVNSSIDEASSATLIGADPSTFSVRDWSALLGNPATAAGFAGQQATLVGFVSASEDGDPDVFFLTRFVVTCCTVDAMPVGVPVSAPAWASDYPVDTWLEVTGTFVTTSDPASSYSLMLKPASVAPVDQPAQPYEY